MKKFTCQCHRCDGSGKYDRGTCFDCKGTGFKNRTTQPRGLTPFVLSVTYSDQSKDTPLVFAATREKAIGIVARACRVAGWNAEIL
jgi:hypothetical protein